MTKRTSTFGSAASGGFRRLTLTGCPDTGPPRGRAIAGCRDSGPPTRIANWSICRGRRRIWTRVRWVRRRAPTTSGYPGHGTSRRTMSGWPRRRSASSAVMATSGGRGIGSGPVRTGCGSRPVMSGRPVGSCSWMAIGISWSSVVACCLRPCASRGRCSSTGASTMSRRSSSAPTSSRSISLHGRVTFTTTSGTITRPTTCGAGFNPGLKFGAAAMTRST